MKFEIRTKRMLMSTEPLFSIPEGVLQDIQKATCEGAKKFMELEELKLIEGKDGKAVLDGEATLEGDDNSD